MKIGFSFHRLAVGGAPCYFAELMEGLAAREHELFYHNYRPSTNKTFSDPRILERIERAAVSVTPQELLACDVIHLDGFNTAHEKKPFEDILPFCVETYHSIRSIEATGPAYAGYRICVCEAILQHVPPPAQVIYYGLNTQRFRPRRSSPPNGTGYDVAILGRIDRIKNHGLFLDVCEELARLRGSTRALIIGGFRGQPEYRRIIEHRIDALLSRGVRVDITGMISPDQVPDHLRTSRALLVTSRSEGLPLAVVEAMGSGVPVVAHPVGGLTEIVRDGSTGLLAKRDDPVSFAHQTQRLLTDPELARSICQNALSFVREGFSIARMVDDYEAVYREAASAREGSGTSGEDVFHRVARSSLTGVDGKSNGSSPVRKPKVSLIMSLRDEAERLPEAVRSVLNQTLEDFELVVVDAGSSHRNRDALHSLDDDRLKLVEDPSASDLTRSLNIGLGIAKGEYIARLNAEDLWLPNCLRTKVTFLDTHPDVGLVGSVAQDIDPPADHETAVQRIQAVGIHSALLRPDFCWEDWVPVFRAECVKRVGIYRDVFRYAPDYDLWLRITDRYGVASLSQPLVKRQPPPDAISGAEEARQRAYAWLAVELAKQRRATGEEDLLVLLDESGPGALDQVELLPEVLGRAYLTQACFNYLVGDTERSKQSVIVALRHDPALLQDGERVLQLIVHYGLSYGATLTSRLSSAQFLDRVFSNLPPAAEDLAQLRSRALGKLYMTSAFANHKKGDLPKVRRDVPRAVVHDPSWLRNRGAWSIFIRSLLHR